MNEYGALVDKHRIWRNGSTRNKKIVPMSLCPR